MENSENPSPKVGLLEEEARKRKERLASLKKTLEIKNESKNNDVNVEKSLPRYEQFFWKCNLILNTQYVLLLTIYFRPKFKSYIPEDEGLKAELIPTPQPGDIVAEVEDQLKAGETVFTVQELVNWCI